MNINKKTWYYCFHFVSPVVGWAGVWAFAWVGAVGAGVAAGWATSRWLMITATFSSFWKSTQGYKVAYCNNPPESFFYSSYRADRNSFWIDTTKTRSDDSIAFYDISILRDISHIDCWIGVSRTLDYTSYSRISTLNNRTNSRARVSDKFNFRIRSIASWILPTRPSGVMTVIFFLYTIICTTIDNDMTAPSSTITTNNVGR